MSSVMKRGDAVAAKERVCFVASILAWHVRWYDTQSLSGCFPTTTPMMDRRIDIEWAVVPHSSPSVALKCRRRVVVLTVAVSLTVIAIFPPMATEFVVDAPFPSPSHKYFHFCYHFRVSTRALFVLLDHLASVRRWSTADYRIDSVTILSYLP